MKKNITYILSLFIFLVFSAMAQKNIDQTKGLEELIDFIGNKYAPDKRVEVFRIKGKVIEEGILLKGETTSEAAYRELIAKASKITSNLNDSVRLLPDKTLGDEHWGIINNSVADLRAKPAYSSEMVTQVLLGMPVKILEKSGSWRRVQTPEGYIGWMSGSLQTQTREQLNDFLAKPKIIVNKQYALSYSEPNKQSQPVSDIVIGNMLPIVEMQKDFFMIIYPDGREAFVQKQDAQKAEDWLNEIKLTGESIVETAKQLMGVPYVWGGTSAKGLDCSGFTKT
ncbi:MAG: SH3 domain-containing protein, partial [Dysgonamonadaceae bacterium]